MQRFLKLAIISRTLDGIRNIILRGRKITLIKSNSSGIPIGWLSVLSKFKMPLEENCFVQNRL